VNYRVGWIPAVPMCPAYDACALEAVVHYLKPPHPNVAPIPAVSPVGRRADVYRRSQEIVDPRSRHRPGWESHAVQSDIESHEAIE